MKKALMRIFLLLGTIVFLTGCNSKAELSDYLEVNFYGYDTMGTASYSIDEERLIRDIFEVSELNIFNLDPKMITEIEDMMSSFVIEMDNESDLSNGDTITVNLKVDNEKSKKIKTKESLKYTVAGLEEPNKLSDEEIEKRIVVNFTGVSGRGHIQIDSTFEGNLEYLSFDSEQEGEIKNGDTVTVKLTDDAKDLLTTHGYILTGKGSADFVASNLKNVAEKPADIENIVDIERLISEGINREYQDSQFGLHKYEIIKEHSFYRQFERDGEEPSDWFSGTPSNGTLVNVYSIKKYDSQGALWDKFTSIYGYTDIFLDENNKASLVDINSYLYNYDDTYSLESIIKLMEGYDYQTIN